MKEEVKTFLEETFHEIQNSVYNDVCGDYLSCNYSVDDAECFLEDQGILEIAGSLRGTWSNKRQISDILEERLSPLSDDEVKLSDYFDIECDDDYVEVGREVNIDLHLYYITVKAKIEKLEELFKGYF